MDGNKQHMYNGNSSSHDEAEDGDDLISVEQLQRLVRLLDRSDVAELELKSADAGTRLVLRKAKLVENAAQGAMLVSVPTELVDDTPVSTSQTIVAPLVGIFHPWAKPKGGTLVAVGDRIKVGQLVATIQSLNVINEVESAFAGRVAEIMVQDGQAVEYGQPLIIVESAEESK